MAIRKKAPVGETGSEFQRRVTHRGAFYAHEWRGIPVARKWPVKRGKPKSQTTRAQNNLFAETVKAIRFVAPDEQAAARALAEGTAYSYRDILFMAMHGEYIEIEGLDQMAITDLLDTISSTPGAMLYRGLTTWVGLAPPPSEAVLAFDIATQLPIWVDPSLTGITELNGDVIAGPGTGAQAAALSETGVTAGVYTFAAIEVDAKGRLLDAASGTPPAYIDELTGDVTAGPGSGSEVATLAPSGVTAGIYTNPQVEFDAKGRAIAASSGTGAAAASGLFAQVRSVTPTRSGTGFTTNANLGTATVIETATGIAISCPGGAGDNLRQIRQVAPSTPYVRRIILTLECSGQNFQAAGFGWTDGTKLHVIMFEYNGGFNDGKVLRWTNATTASATDASPDPGAPATPRFYEIEDDGTNVYFRKSADGDRFRTMFNVSKTAGFLGSTGYSNLVFFGNRNNSVGTSTATASMLSYK